jgi:hypothetical protein
VRSLPIRRYWNWILRIVLICVRDIKQSFLRASTATRSVGMKFARWLRPRVPRLKFRQRKRTVLVPALLGVLASAVSYFWFSTALTPPTPPKVDGAGEIYIDRPDVPTQLRVTFAQKDQEKDRSKVNVELVFRSMGGKPVRWAMMLYRDARLINVDNHQRTFVPPGVTITQTQAGDPPFRENPKEDAQIIQGVSYPTNDNGRATSVRFSGWIRKAVFSERGPRLVISLPRYGRLRVPPILQFPRDADAIDLGVPERLRRPDTFQVDVMAGENAPGQRIDVASPDVLDPASLAWQDDETVRALLQRTDLAGESRQQILVFVLGAVVGAGVSLLMAAAEKLLIDTEPKDVQSSHASAGP